MKHLCFTVLYFLSLSLLAQNIDTIKLKDFHPISIYKVPVSNIEKAKYPAYDMHSHDDDDLSADDRVKLMDKCGIAKSMILSYATGKKFDSVVAKYAGHKDRFLIWCGFDYTGADQPGWSDRAVAELERCYKKGAVGVGELGDKGSGELYSLPTPGYGIHIDDPRLKPLLQKCAELKMPISIHVSEDAWMYLPADAKNDGMMNAGRWKVDMTVKGKLNHDELVQTLENAVRDNPTTTFIACHLANTCSDLTQIGKLFDKYSNLYADVAARYGEIAPIPKFAHTFLEKYSDRIVYGTDMGATEEMYRITYRILESGDEHFYDYNNFNYHWALYGLQLTDNTLKKIYYSNAQKILGRK
ncbi:MAG: amidohydrolase family protein [Flavitalea sp.]